MRHIFILFLFSFKSFGQSNDNPIYILNEKGETITQQTFKQQASTGKYTWMTYETKDSLNARLILREVYSTISSQQKEQLIEYLKEITGISINEDQTIVINFAFKDTSPNQVRHCLDLHSSKKSYRNSFKRKEQFAQFYISQKGFNYPKDFVFEDKNDMIRKMLFPYGLDCNYIIIKPDGRFYRQMSEHHQDQILKKAKADW